MTLLSDVQPMFSPASVLGDHANIESLRSTETKLICSPSCSTRSDSGRSSTSNPVNKTNPWCHCLASGVDADGFIRQPTSRRLSSTVPLTDAQ